MDAVYLFVLCSPTGWLSRLLDLFALPDGECRGGDQGGEAGQGEGGQTQPGGSHQIQVGLLMFSSLFSACWHQCAVPPVKVSAHLRARPAGGFTEYVIKAATFCQEIYGKGRKKMDFPSREHTVSSAGVRAD